MASKTEPKTKRASKPITKSSRPALLLSNPSIERNGKPSQEDVRRRAYEKWEAAGKPVGDGVEFWLRAEQELLAVH
jgi:hypothetical protein